MIPLAYVFLTRGAAFIIDVRQNGRYFYTDANSFSLTCISAACYGYNSSHFHTFMNVNYGWVIWQTWMCKLSSAEILGELGSPSANLKCV